MVICDYLDETYPDPPLYPSDPWAKGWDRCLIEIFNVKVTGNYYKIYSKPTDKAVFKEIADAVNQGLQIFEDELAKRGSKYFFGNQPGKIHLLAFKFGESNHLFQ